MPIPIWCCDCGKNYSTRVLECRKCGAPQKAYGFKDEPTNLTPKKRRKATPAAKPTERRPVESLDSDEKLFESNIKFR